MNNILNLVWLKRDFRINDHAPFFQASLNLGAVIPFYVFEEDYWNLPDSSFRHWSFVYDSLLALNSELSAYKNRLYFYQGQVIEFLDKFKNNNIILWSHEETGNDWTYQRDKKIKIWCEANHVKWHEFPTNGIIRCLKSRDDWSQLRNQIINNSPIEKPYSLQAFNENIDFKLIDNKEIGLFKNIDYTKFNLQRGGRYLALKILQTFLDSRSIDYNKNISKPYGAWHSCSRLSPYITFGNVSIREVYYLANKRIESLKSAGNEYQIKNIRSFLSRIAWHCHFIQKLEQQPSIEFKCMHNSFEGIRDSNNPEYLNAWIKGKTGYPLIDACMRALTIHGWINFRMRAMVTSFASYNLWLDWRYFGPKLAQLFIDYEPGIHYSQLQMQSGVTGINSIRIYNPVKQSAENDADGVFIKKYVPELSKLPIEYVHQPWLMNEQEQKLFSCRLGLEYPYPIVDHLETAKIAKKIIFDCKKKTDFSQESQNIFERLGSRKTNKKKSLMKKHPEFDF